MTQHIAILPGDGIGPEIIAQAVRVLDRLIAEGLDAAYQYAPIGGAGYDEYGAPYPEFTQKLCHQADAVLLGAVGGPQYDNLDRPLRPERGLLAIRKDLNLFANLRPAILYKELANQSIAPDQIPVIAFSVGEQELSGIDTKPLVGHLAAWNYFESINTPANETFIQSWKAFKKDSKAVTNDPMEATYIGFNMWVKAVEKAGSTEPDAVKKALIGVEVPNLTGGSAKMLANHMITKPVFIGEIQDNGQFDVVWQTEGEVAGEAWSPLLPESANLVADWADPVNCGAYDQAAKKCTAGVK